MEWWERRALLGTDILSTRRLYLDTRYWNDLCDVELGANANTEAVACLSAIRKQVSSGRLTCVVEYHTFEELFQQKLPDKRRLCAKLVDELSRRTMMMPPPERVFLEVLRLSQAASANRAIQVAPVGEVWTRPIFIAGHTLPSLPTHNLPPEVAAALQREFEEVIWNTPFDALLEIVPSLAIGKAERADAAERLNRGKQDARQRFKSVRALYLSEVGATLRAYNEQLAKVLLYLYYRAGGDDRGVPNDEAQVGAESLARFVLATARKPGIVRTLPTIHIGAQLYAHVQWDLERRYEANDLPDFGHAEAALAYCDAFATERSLAALLNQSKLTADYACAVLANYRTLNEWLELDAGDAAKAPD